MRSAYIPLLLFAGSILCAPTVTAQSHQSPSNRIDVTVTYDASRTNITTGSSFWLQGGSAEIAGNLPRGLSIVGHVSGQRSGSIASTQVPLSLVTFTFGPRYTWHIRKSRISLFGQALAGEASAFDSVFPASGGAASSAHSSALQIGGGVDTDLTHRLSLRLVQTEWMRTGLPNASSNIQNHLNVNTGFSFHF